MAETGSKVKDLGVDTKQLNSYRLSFLDPGTISVRRKESWHRRDPAGVCPGGMSQSGEVIRRRKQANHPGPGTNRCRLEAISKKLKTMWE